MNDSTGQDGTQATTPPATLGLTALQRRRLLLRGVGKGGAVLAAAVPLASFANAPVLKTAGEHGTARLCSVSGMGSVLVSSAVVGGTCTGKSAQYWHDLQTWPAFNARGVAVTQRTKWKTIFGGSGANHGAKTFKELLSLDFSSDPKQIWVRAMLNAAAGFPGTFPYDPPGVLALYKGSNQAAAQTFFKDWV